MEENDEEKEKKRENVFPISKISFHNCTIHLECLTPEGRNEAADLLTSVDLTGIMLWPASFLLSSFICSQDAAKYFKNKSVIEIGCGAGMCGLFCAYRGATEVTLSDEKSYVTELAERNITRNQKDIEKVNPSIKSMNAIVYSWNKFNEQNNQLRNHYDVVVSSDTVYSRSSVKDFASGIFELLKIGGRAYLAYPFREKGLVEEFHNLLDKIGLKTIEVRDLIPEEHFVLIDEDIHQKYPYTLRILEKFQI